MPLFANHRDEPREGGVVMHNMFVVTNIELGQDEQAQRLLQGAIQSAAQPKPTAEDYFAAGTAEQYSSHADQARNALKNLGS